MRGSITLITTLLSYVIASETKLVSNPSLLPASYYSRSKRQFNQRVPPNQLNFQQQQQQQQQQFSWGQQNVNGFNSQRPPQNGQGSFLSQGSFNGQGQNTPNQFGSGQLQQQQQQQQSWNNNFGVSSNLNQQASASGSTNVNNIQGQGSSNGNQPTLWNSNQSDYQCVVNNCRGQNLQWDPICGSDNLVYDNVAVMRCAQQCGRRISFNYYGTCVVTTTAASKKK